MKKIFRRINILLVIVALAAAGYAVYTLWPRDEAGGGYRKQTLDAARVKSLRDMARLSSLEIYEETGVRDTINGKGLFAIMRLEGSIGYDVDRLGIDSIGVDSIRVTLPKESIELRESTESGSYRVVDVWNISYPLLGASLSASEENALKARAIEKVRRLAYSRGYVDKARATAISTLEQMYSALPGVYVEVSCGE